MIAADGSATVNTDYFTNVELTSANPQVVTYTINPKAVWTDGTPITWEDITSQIRGQQRKNTAFVDRRPNGFERVASVTRGVDDRQAVMTFAKPYAEWKGMFAGNGHALPKSMTATPEAFNKAQLNEPGPSAGPFLVSNIDRECPADHDDAATRNGGAPRPCSTPSPTWCSTTQRAFPRCRTTPSTPRAQRRWTN